MVTVPAIISGSKFQFLKTDKGTIPNNCPIVKDKDGNVVNDNPETGEKPATKKFKTLGLFPVSILFQRAFAEDPTFNWEGYWGKQCSGDGLKAVIDKNEILSDFDKMQKERLGDLVTGAETMTGDFGRKAILENDLDFAGKAFDNLIGLSTYIEDGMKKREFPESARSKTSCDGDRKIYCEDAMARAYLGIGKMVAAAVKSGFSKGKKISSALVDRTADPAKLGNMPTGKDFSADPYVVGAEALYRCMLESEDGSLKRDICTEMIKDVAVAGIKANDRQVYDDAIKHLGGYYDKDFFDGKKNKWDNLKTWVNSTVWMADGLIELMEAEDAGTIAQSNPGTKALIDAFKNQKKEGLMEFSTADWIAQQALIITANKGQSGIFNHHDDIIKEVIQNRLSVWNPWLELYTNSFKRCPPETLTCMGDATSPANKALSQLASSINIGCLGPIAEKMAGGKSLTSLDNDAIENCSKAIGQIIEKAGDEGVLREATETYFFFGNEGSGLKFMPKVKENLEKAISNRFEPSFIRRMKGSKTLDPIKEMDNVIQAYNVDMFNRRYDRPATTEEGKKLDSLLGRETPSSYTFLRNYLIDTVSTKDGVTSEIIKDDKSPLFIIETRAGTKPKFVPKDIVDKFEK